MLRMMRLRRKTGPKTGKHTLCEPEWSKSMSTCHKRHQKSHFGRKFTGKMRRPRFGPERRRRLCASLRSRNACPHVTRDIRKATLYGNLPEKCRGPRTRAAPQNESRTQTNTLREPVQSKRMSKYQKSYFLRKFTGKKSASLRSRATLCGNLQVKCRRPKPRCTLCASLRGRNAMKRMSKCQ